MGYWREVIGKCPIASLFPSLPNPLFLPPPIPMVERGEEEVKN